MGDCQTRGAMEKPDYGIDAWSAVRNVAVIGAALIAVGALDRVFGRGTALYEWWRACLSPGCSLLLAGTLMYAYARWGKFRHRDRMLGLIDWKGDETVLDVGTGRGLLMIGAAKHLTSGRSYGIDIWSEADLSGNSIENARHNVELEGVADKIEIRGDDARSLGFADDSFDVILTNLCLHNIPSAQGRAQACREIARVLKPGGTALVSDFRNSWVYRKTLRNAGLQTHILPPHFWYTFPPLSIVRADKPE